MKNKEYPTKTALSFLKKVKLTVLINQERFVIIKLNSSERWSNVFTEREEYYKNPMEK